MKKILVCGSRNCENKFFLYKILDAYKPFHLIAGGARGADKLAEQWADDNNQEKTIIKADWDTHGKRAGYIRNKQMIDLEPNLVIAFWDNKSKGTANTISLAKSRKIDTHIYYF